MEIRLCSIRGARWLDELSNDGEVPDPPKGLGLAFEKSITRRISEISNVGTLKRSSVEGFVLALAGVSFESIRLISSTVHAGACANIASGEAEQNVSFEICQFVEGVSPYSNIPNCLRQGGVYSCLEHDDALRFAKWLHLINATDFSIEVMDMYGAEALSVYQAVFRSLTRTLGSVSTHGSDLQNQRCQAPPNTSLFNNT